MWFFCFDPILHSLHHRRLQLFYRFCLLVFILDEFLELVPERVFALPNILFWDQVHIVFTHSLKVANLLNHRMQFLNGLCSVVHLCVILQSKVAHPLLAVIKEMAPLDARDVGNLVWSVQELMQYDKLVPAQLNHLLIWDLYNLLLFALSQSLSFFLWFVQSIITWAQSLNGAL